MAVWSRGGWRVVPRARTRPRARARGTTRQPPLDHTATPLSYVHGSHALPVPTVLRTQVPGTVLRTWLPGTVLRTWLYHRDARGSSFFLWYRDWARVLPQEERGSSTIHRDLGAHLWTRGSPRCTWPQTQPAARAGLNGSLSRGPKPDVASPPQGGVIVLHVTLVNKPFLQAGKVARTLE